MLAVFAYVRTPAARRLECCASPLHTQTLASRRLRTCDGATLGAARLAAALPNRTLAFVGDSTLHQLYEAFVFDLRAAAVHMRTLLRESERELQPSQLDAGDGCATAAGAKGRSKAGGAEVRLEWRWEGVKSYCEVIGWSPKAAHWAKCRKLPDEEVHLPQSNTRLLWYRTNGNFSSTKQGRCGDTRHTFTERLEAAIAASDTLVVSLGTWYNEDDAAASPAMYDAVLAHVFGRLAALPHGVPRKLGLWVQTLPQHFYTPSGDWRRRGRRKGGGGEGSGTWGERKMPQCPETCAATREELDWRQAAAARAARAAGITEEGVVPTAAMLQPLHLLHKRTKFRCQLDCTHYCYSPVLWGGLLDGLYRRLYNSASLNLGGLPSSGRRRSQAKVEGNMAGHSRAEWRTANKRLHSPGS
ncbi:hypothetical protein AB1Y20_011982 [Prymnesium parvum]|uniref:Uncharacterized protein n=1 Tax=Prymnesium parvum TaxID=97485 RepID=A0AB34IPL5_PRYPA